MLLVLPLQPPPDLLDHDSASLCDDIQIMRNATVTISYPEQRQRETRTCGVIEAVRGRYLQQSCQATDAQQGT